MFARSNVALVTPMLDNGAVDERALGELVEWQIASGTNGLVAVGTTGESATLTVDEHVDVIRCVVEAAAGRVKVIAGTGANSTAEAIELTRHAKQAGADGALLVTPYYNKPPQEGLYQHYAAVAGAVDIPIILYNVPGRTGCDLLPATVERLAAVENIVACKEAVGDPARVCELVERVGDRLTLLSGDDATSRAAMLAGFHGVISVTANVAPAALAKLCATATAGDAEGAAAIDATLAALHDKLFIQPNPIPVKWALQQMGRIGPTLRLPLVPLDALPSADFENASAAIRTALQNAKLL